MAPAECSDRDAEHIAVISVFIARPARASTMPVEVMRPEVNRMSTSGPLTRNERVNPQLRQSVPMSELGNFLRQARRRAKLSQQALANGFRISKAAVSKWESGITVPDRRKMQQLAQTLGVSVDQLRDLADQDDAAKQEDVAGWVARPPRTPETQSPAGSADPLRVYGSVEGGPDGAFVLSDGPVAWIARDARLVGVVDAFAVYVQGTSMIHAYEPGNLLLINPGAQPISGDDVLLVREERSGTRSALVKRLVRYNATAWTVKQFNPEKTYSLPRSDWQQAYLVIGKYNRG